MKIKTVMPLTVFLIMLLNCSNNVEYSQDVINTTSGRYLYSQDEVIDVYYENNTLFLKWRGNDKLKPVALDETTFFVPDMYKKLRFVQQPETQKRYMGIVSENDDSSFTYDYLKVADSFKTPSMHLKANNFDEALAGFLDIKKQDSTSVLIEEREFNSYGYELLRKEENDHAIAVFKMNVALYPESDNVYDSLADAYLRTGDSLNAYENYKKALELNSGNPRAKRFVKAFEKK
ncbi:tetratricopeptide repeat protein [Hanstruepera marina]|uniref:tetratricopeptide repeat protein n=1 Tax=Hanstruepera marina TaxID=2873265 RepID=UPI001CA622B5|nr:tetratricopeptide repeat protein [Hanstruepera marina]